MNKILLAFLLASSIAQAATGQFIGVAATPTPLGDERFAARLLQIDPSQPKPKEIAQLAPADGGVLFVKTWSDAGYIVLGTPTSGPLTLKIIDLGKPGRVATVDLDAVCKGCIYVDAHFTRTSLNEAVIRVRFSQNKQIVGRSIDLASAMVVQDVSLPARLYAEGVPAPGIAGDFFYVNADEIRNGATWADVPPPTAFMNTGSDPMVAYVSTNRIIVLTSKYARVREGLGQTRYAVYFRPAKTWHQISIPGGRTDLRVLGDWLAGTVSRDAPESPSGVAVSVGSAPTKAAFESRSRVFQIQSTGRLVLHNARTHQQFEIPTQHPDSEVLGVVENQLYYRIDDSLYQSALTEGGISAPRLLMRDPAIADIHWLLSSR